MHFPHATHSTTGSMPVSSLIPILLVRAAS
ncbi:hypothetical protein PIIN_10080 [Serendipita indica DSM 11827]|uniref:Uncharacterized protein n=1 Tax=Serendipita indica (strain DSM 11827) TaxID=1109443 RepID=G4TXN7_SERID|nr:hypothetical protein PIIN_10080 [Serendipita indica DSM 11827]